MVSLVDSQHEQRKNKLISYLKCVLVENPKWHPAEMLLSYYGEYEELVHRLKQ